MKSLKKLITLGLSVLTCLSATGQQINSDTPNLDFSLGNFENWKLYTGWFERDDAAT